MTGLTAARIQMELSLAFHVLFAAVLVCGLQGRQITRLISAGDFLTDRQVRKGPADVSVNTRINT